MIMMDGSPIRAEISAQWRSVTLPPHRVRRPRARPAPPVGAIAGPVQADLRAAPVQTVPTVSDPIGANIIDVFRTPGDATAQDHAQNSGPGAVVQNGTLELIFWGTAWEGPISPSMDQVIAAAESILASPYLSELAQYGFQSMTLRGGLLVANDPPSPTYSSDDVKNLISNLVDQGALPEVDEVKGGLLYVVFAPPGTRYADSSASGAHTDDYDYDFPGDLDWLALGWVNYSTYLNQITSTFSHELVEMITDPLPNQDPAWHMNRDINLGNELGDACNNSYATVDGILVQAYWSERQKACIIPRHAYWAAGISQQRLELTMNETDTGTALIKGTGGDCRGGTYTWWRKDIFWQHALTAVASDYTEPIYSWTVAGQVLPDQSNATIQFSVNQLFPEPDPQVGIVRPGQAGVQYTTNGKSLILSNDPNNGIFDFPVSVEVTEANPLPGVDSSSTASTSVSFTGQVIEYDQAYYRDRNRCIQHLVNRVSRVAHVKQFPQPPGPPPPPVWTDQLPGWLSADTHLELRRLARLGKAAESADPKAVGELRSTLGALYGIPSELL